MAAALICAAVPVYAADPSPDQRLKALEDELKKARAEHDQIKQRAEAQAKELSDLKSEMVTSARAVQEQEEQLSDLEGKLRKLRKQELDKSRQLDLRRQQTTGVLTALQRLAWRPSEALIAQPTSPADTVRSAILLRSALPRIEQSARALRGEIENLAQVRTDINQQRQQVASLTDRLEDEHKRLRGLVSRKAQIQQKAEAESAESEKRVTQMAAEAADLRELLAKLEEERKRRIAEAEEARKRKVAEAAAAAKAAREAEVAARKAANQAEIDAARQARDVEARANREAEAAAREAQLASGPVARGRPFSQAQGEMPMPARGRIVTGFGQQTGSGTESKGLSIETRSGAQVVAPYDGQVAFAGPFRGYGLLLIIDHGEGYHTLLAGMARIDSAVGHRLSAGEPVGIMGDAEGTPGLYVELRRNGQPINPMPWLTARKTKVTG